jgi:hypothetical protein
VIALQRHLSGPDCQRCGQRGRLVVRSDRFGRSYLAASLSLREGRFHV